MYFSLGRAVMLSLHVKETSAANKRKRRSEADDDKPCCRGDLSNSMFINHITDAERHYALLLEATCVHKACPSNATELSSSLTFRVPCWIDS